ncbi:monofunctional biosynthetic peptidoglycan transglycosylase [Rubrolithibacter danxiaensis]|uniref:monofunctional biosynthetic peptidoglycan transglycosylase n=1 Tax=Rubrolithibacter danxiaensis TaxID=3390805 RepID=UPI003BF85F40
MLKKKPSKKKKRSGIVRTILKVIYGFLAFTVFWVFVYRFVNPPVTWLMIERGFERKFAGKDWKLEKEWKDFDELSSNLKLAAVAGEDANFLHHWGFDLKAIKTAYKKNKQGTRKRGGSTISQQVAKNVFLWPGRSWLRKGFEAYFTALIEIFWSKERILEVYLNVAEMGDGIYGAEAASRFYYHKSSSALTKRQASLLIAILPSPLRWSPVKPSPFVSRKAYLIRRNMKSVGKLKF